MNRSALTAALATGLLLTSCQNQPEEEGAGSSEDSVTPTAPETVDGDEIVSEGPSDDATPYAGTTGGRDGDGRNDGSGANAGASGTASGAGSMASGNASPAGARPPKGSKLQKAD